MKNISRSTNLLVGHDSYPINANLYELDGRGRSREVIGSRKMYDKEPTDYKYGDLWDVTNGSLKVSPNLISRDEIYPTTPGTYDTYDKVTGILESKNNPNTYSGVECTTPSVKVGWTTVTFKIKVLSGTVSNIGFHAPSRKDDFRMLVDGVRMDAKNRPAAIFKVPDNIMDGYEHTITFVSYYLGPDPRLVPQVNRQTEVLSHYLLYDFCVVNGANDNLEYKPSNKDLVPTSGLLESTHSSMDFNYSHWKPYTNRSTDYIPSMYGAGDVIKLHDNTVGVNLLHKYLPSGYWDSSTGALVPANPVNMHTEYFIELNPGSSLYMYNRSKDDVRTRVLRYNLSKVFQTSESAYEIKPDNYRVIVTNSTSIPILVRINVDSTTKDTDNIIVSMDSKLPSTARYTSAPDYGKDTVVRRSLDSRYQYMNSIQEITYPRVPAREFITLPQWDVAPLVSKYGLDEWYHAILDISLASLDTDTVNLYFQNGSGTKYSLKDSILHNNGKVKDTYSINTRELFKVKDDVVRVYLSFTLQESSKTETRAQFAIYCKYDTGAIPKVHGMRIGVGKLPDNYKYLTPITSRDFYPPMTSDYIVAKKHNAWFEPTDWDFYYPTHHTEVPTEYRRYDTMEVTSLDNRDLTLPTENGFNPYDAVAFPSYSTIVKRDSEFVTCKIETVGNRSSSLAINSPKMVPKLLGKIVTVVVESYYEHDPAFGIFSDGTGKTTSQVPNDKLLYTYATSNRIVSSFVVTSSIEWIVWTRVNIPRYTEAMARVRIGVFLGINPRIDWSKNLLAYCMDSGASRKVISTKNSEVFNSNDWEVIS